MPDLVSLIRASAEQAEPFGAVIKLDTGDDGVICIDGTGEKIVVDNTDRDANTAIILSRDNLNKLVRGKLNPAMAVMTGKIRIEGDMTLALKLASFL